MKTHQFKDSGILWRLATTYGDLEDWDLREHGTDVCTYTRSVLLGVGLVMLVVAVIIAILAPLCDLITWLVVCVQTHQLVLPLSDLGEVAVGYIILAAIIGFVYGGYFVLSRRKYAARRENSVVSMIKARLHKYCFPITFGEQPVNHE